MTIKEIIQKSNQLLYTYSPTPELDTYLIVEYVTGLNQLECIMQGDTEIPPHDQEHILTLIAERIHHKPIAYIIGYKEFYGRVFNLTPDVLIPRPETEAIIDIVKTSISNQSPIIWEIGTGSGCIAITLALEIPSATIIAGDISENALRVAKNNDILITGKRCPISWLHSDLIEDFPQQQPDIIVANLPYLDQNTYTDDSLLYEPNIALYSPHKGLDHYIRLITNILSRFVIYPRLLIEINPEQADELSPIILKEAPQSEFHIYQDIQHLNRHMLINLKK